MPTKRRSGYRPVDSYTSKDPVKRERQLANLRQYHKRKPKASDQIKQHSSSIIDLAEHCFLLQETRQPVVLQDWQKTILTDLFEVDDPPTLALLGMPKKSGKSTLAALVALWYLVTKPDAECYIVGPDFDQGAMVIFSKLVKAVRLHPTLSDTCKITKDSIEHTETGAVVRVLPVSKTSAGLNPDLVIFDELWQFTSLEAARTIDELCNVPGKHSLVLVVTYAGYEDETETHLYRWYKQGLDIQEGRADPDPTLYWVWRTDYEGVPWVTEKYLESQRKRLRENTYKRFHENAWVSSEQSFISAEIIDDCTDPDLSRGRQDAPGRPFVCVGVDIGLKHDTSALAVVSASDDGRLTVVDHAVFTPKDGMTLDLEKTVEACLRVYAVNYQIRGVYYDPYQFARSARTLQGAGIPMLEYPQTLDRTVGMSETLYSLLSNRGLVLYPDPELRQHLLNCMATESQRGWRIVKKRESQKIDLAVALAMACRAAQDILVMRTPAGFSVYNDDENDENDEFLWHECGFLENLLFF